METIWLGLLPCCFRATALAVRWLCEEPQDLTIRTPK